MKGFSFSLANFIRLSMRVSERFSHLSLLVPLDSTENNKEKWTEILFNDG